MTPSWILCDLGNTLVNFDHRTAARRFVTFLVTHPLRLRGKIPTQEAFFNFLYAGTGNGVSRNTLMDRGAVDLQWLAEEIGRELHIKISEDELRPFWCEIFTTINQDVADAMRRARAKGPRVAICSSTNAPHWKYILGNYPELNDVYDSTFLSFEMGISKKDATFFPAIIDRANTPGTEFLLLDDLEENIVAARECGMEAVLYNGQLPEHQIWS